MGRRYAPLHGQWLNLQQLLLPIHYLRIMHNDTDGSLLIFLDWETAAENNSSYSIQLSGVREDSEDP